jgi:hypothetical protein
MAQDHFLGMLLVGYLTKILATSSRHVFSFDHHVELSRHLLQCLTSRHLVLSW